MKIVVIGNSPYFLFSSGRVNAMLLEYLYFSQHAVAGIVFNHDTVYFMPEDGEDGMKKFYYEIDKTHKIPIVPIGPDQKEPAIPVYEVLNMFEPDMVITVGDYNEFLYMKAVKMFCTKSFKWLAVMMNYSYPINEKNIELLEYVDAILCTSKDCFSSMTNLFKRDEISLAYVGSEAVSDDLIDSRDKLRLSRKIENSFRLMVCGKNAQIDNIPMLMEVVAKLRSRIPEIELYVHANVYDNGDYDLNLLRDRFDSAHEFIKFPEKYVSLIDGYGKEEFCQEIIISDLFVSIQMISASAMGIFEALNCGCPVLMSDVGCHGDLADMLSDFCPELQRNDFLSPCIELLGTGETYLNVCDPVRLEESIFSFYQKINKKAGYRARLREIVKAYSRKEFLKEISNKIKEVEQIKPILCVESA